MKAVIKRYHYEESEDLSTYKADEPAVFGYTLTFTIGPNSGAGEDYFEVFVASTRYLAQLDSAQAPAFLRHVIVAPDYNVPAAVALIEKYVSVLDEPSWAELAIKLSRVLRWEFEDYHTS